MNRAVSVELESILGNAFPVLDHGFIRVIDYMGNDSAIVQAARVSYGEGTKKLNQDRGLIMYLMKHKHTSPFEMCEIKFHIKMPIFVARQWIRHRTANVNEVSARYSILPSEFYIPEKENISSQSKDNKQGRGDVLDFEKSSKIIEILTEDSKQCYNHYEEMLSENYNLARELARMNLTLNCYTEWYWKIDLHNLLHFLHLRMHPHAQYEIRVYAEKIFEIVKSWCPIAAESFEEHILNAKTFSKNQLEAIAKMLNGIDFDEASKNLSERDKKEISEVINL